MTNSDLRLVLRGLWLMGLVLMLFFGTHTLVDQEKQIAANARHLLDLQTALIQLQGAATNHLAAIHTLSANANQQDALLKMAFLTLSNQNVSLHHARHLIEELGQATALLILMRSNNISIEIMTNEPSRARPGSPRA